MIDERLGVVDARVLGGFNWSSQRLDEEELRWEQFGVVRRIVRGGLRCGRPGGRRWRGGGAGRRPVVPRGWRDGVGQPAPAVGPLLVVQ